MSNRGVGTTRRTIPVADPSNARVSAVRRQGRFAGWRCASRLRSVRTASASSLTTSSRGERTCPSLYPATDRPWLVPLDTRFCGDERSDSVFPIDRYARCAVPARRPSLVADSGRSSRGTDPSLQGHASAVFNHCYQRVLSRSDAEDLTAEVFLAALQTGSRVQVFPGRRHPALVARGREQLTASAPCRPDERITAARRVGRTPGRGARRCRRARRRDRRSVSPHPAGCGIERATCADRDIIQLCVLQGLSPGVVAELTGRRPGTVRSRLSRALSRARRQLTQLEAAGSAAATPAATATTATTVTTSERSMPR